MAKRQATTRIIAGKYRGTKLTFKPNKSLRPTESKTKETLFNWLLNDLDNKNCLDMFAGTGSLGFEALSRGAKEVIFIEKQKSLCNSIEDVAKQLGIKKKCRIINANSTSINFNNLNAKFDLIFLDPPYKEERIDFILENIIKNKIINKKGLVILHRNKKTKDHFSDKLKIVENRTYGISKIYLIKLR